MTARRLLLRFSPFRFWSLSIAVFSNTTAIAIYSSRSTVTRSRSSLKMSTLAESDFMLRTSRYCALSNLSDFPSIENMLSTSKEDTCVYGSVGVDNIMNGMRDFFQRYPRVYWEYDTFHMYNPHSVEFSFRRYWTDIPSGNVMVTSATEVIEFEKSSPGSITKIYYTKQPNEAQVFGTAYPQTQAGNLIDARKTAEETSGLYP